MKNQHIEIKEIKNIVPSKFLHKIKLLVNKDIPKEPKTAEDLILQRLSQCKESDIQQHFYKETRLLASELQFKDKFNQLEFVQVDNGDTAVGRLTQGQRIALCKRKKAEGSQKGFPDAQIIFYSSKINYRDVVFCEVKRIGSPSQIKLTYEQLIWFTKLNAMGFNAYITNDYVFFRDVVLGEIKKNYF